MAFNEWSSFEKKNSVPEIFSWSCSISLDFWNVKFYMFDFTGTGHGCSMSKKYVLW